MNLYSIYTDGASRGNPGQAGIGVAIYNESGELVEQYREYIGTATNNVAEYSALIAGLSLVKKFLPCGISVFMDSELLVKQMRGEYRVKNQNLQQYHHTAQSLSSSYLSSNFTYIPREKNSVADKLANEAIDKKIIIQIPQK